MNKNLTLLNHPLVQNLLGMIRQKDLRPSEFRSLMSEISRFLAYEATKDLSLSEQEIETPLQKTTVKKIEKYPLVISILRAGNGMLDGVLSVLTGAKAGHIGIYRDKFINNTVEYYFRIPDNCENNDVILIDPVIATADTAIASIDRLKQYGVGRIRLLSFIVSESGVSKLNHFHPDVDIWALAIEPSMNDDGLLLPGIGDIGARLYNQ